MDLSDLRPKGQKISQVIHEGPRSYILYQMIQELAAEMVYGAAQERRTICECHTSLLMRSGCQCGGS
jgi:hypothetical protein